MMLKGKRPFQTLYRRELKQDMCRATVIFEEKLGRRREGWCVYLNQSQDFTWYSDKQIRSKISAGEVINGVTVTETGMVEMDKTFTTGLLAKTGLATFTPINEDEDTGVSKYFAVTRVIKNGKTGDLYELVSNRFKLEIVDENRLKALLSLISVGGATLDEKGKVVIHKDVVVEQTTEDQNKNQRDSTKDGQK